MNMWTTSTYNNVNEFHKHNNGKPKPDPNVWPHVYKVQIRQTSSMVTDYQIWEGTSVVILKGGKVVD